MQTLRPRRARRELKRIDFPNADQVKKNFGERIRTARIEAELTQHQLAEVAGVSRALVDHVEAGRNFPSLTVCIVFCRALGLGMKVVDVGT